MELICLNPYFNILKRVQRGLGGEMGKKKRKVTPKSYSKHYHVGVAC